MPIKGVLFDLDGPLLVDGTVKPRPDIPALLAALHAHGIVIGAASSSATAGKRAAHSGLPIDHVLKQSRCGNKGTGNYVAAFCGDAGFETHDCLTVWDDQFGFREGINGRTLAFHAEWGGGISKYGIRLQRPEELLEYIEVFFLKNAPWFAELNATDTMGREVIARALIDGNGAGSEKIRQAIYETLKERKNVHVNGAPMPLVLVTHMVASAYLDGLLSSDRDQVLWQIYPGHAVKSDPPPIIQETIQHLTLFRSRAGVKSLYGLNRVVDAPQSHKIRLADGGQAVEFINQMNSLALVKGTDVEGK